MGLGSLFGTIFRAIAHFLFEILAYGGPPVIIIIVIIVVIVKLEERHKKEKARREQEAKAEQVRRKSDEKEKADSIEVSRIKAKFLRGDMDDEYIRTIRDIYISLRNVFANTPGYVFFGGAFGSIGTPNLHIEWNDAQTQYRPLCMTMLKSTKSLQLIYSFFTNPDEYDNNCYIARCEYSLYIRTLAELCYESYAKNTDYTIEKVCGEEGSYDETALFQDRTTSFVGWAIVRRNGN